MTITLTVEEQPNLDDAAAVRDGLYAFNIPYAGDGDPRELNAFVRDEAGVIIGGLLGRTAWRYLHVGILWVAEAHRGQGHGTTLMDAAESEARARGCLYAHLDTFSYQALPFYEARGYVPFGELPDFPPGYSRIYLRKVL